MTDKLEVLLDDVESFIIDAAENCVPDYQTDIDWDVVNTMLESVKSVIRKFHGTACTSSSTPSEM